MLGIRGRGVNDLDLAIGLLSFKGLYSLLFDLIDDALHFRWVIFVRVFCAQTWWFHVLFTRRGASSRLSGIETSTRLDLSSK